jgi:hypothetical protein
MDWDLIEPRWHEYRAAAKRRWDKLSEAQISGTRGNRAYLVKRVQEAYALNSQEAERQVADWQGTLFDRRARAANGP